MGNIRTEQTDYGAGIEPFAALLAISELFPPPIQHPEAHWTPEEARQVACIPRHHRQMGTW